MECTGLQCLVQANSQLLFAVEFQSTCSHQTGQNLFFLGTKNKQNTHTNTNRNLENMWSTPQISLHHWELTKTPDSPDLDKDRHRHRQTHSWVQAAIVWSDTDQFFELHTYLHEREVFFFIWGTIQKRMETCNPADVLNTLIPHHREGDSSQRSSQVYVALDTGLPIATRDRNLLVSTKLDIYLFSFHGLRYLNSDCWDCISLAKLSDMSMLL